MSIQDVYDRFFFKLSKAQQEFFKSHERPEQELLYRYLPKRCTVLELGGGCGQTACVIDSILDETFRSKHLVIEPSLDAFHRVKQLQDTIDAQFQLKHAFLAKHRGPQEQLWDDCRRVQNISELHDTYDVISADCEGAFVHVCNDFPELLTNAKMIFLENDGDTPAHRQMLIHAGFEVMHTQVHPYYNCKTDHGWKGRADTVEDFLKGLPSMLYFHEVWIKNKC